MSLVKKVIEGVMYDVISEREFFNNPSINTQFTAIDMGNGFIYPVRSLSKYDNNPGVKNAPGIYYRPDNGIHMIQQPTTAKEIEEYNSSDNLIDFRAAEDMRDYIQTKQRLASAERSILTSIDNVFLPEISENDTPEMIALKQAILDKHIDLDKYEPRFGPNYNNDKRLLKKNSITFGKLRAICDALDMKATITFEDANPEVPNPIGRVITAELTGEGMSVEVDDK